MTQKNMFELSLNQLTSIHGMSKLQFDMLMCFAITYKGQGQQVMKSMKRESNNQYICRKRLEQIHRAMLVDKVKL